MAHREGDAEGPGDLPLSSVALLTYLMVWTQVRPEGAGGPGGRAEGCRTEIPSPSLCVWMAGPAVNRTNPCRDQWWC